MEPTLSPRDHINKLYTERAENRLWCEDAFDTGVFAQGLLDGGRFFNEILQNTDDAKSDRIWCCHNGQDLIFMHAGNHFSPKDVEKVCGFAKQRFSEKSEDASQTGYKGIGFKSLTAIAETIYIFSAGYTFRFDERHWAGQAIPWHRIPIWTELKDVPRHLQSHLTNHQAYVNIVLILRPTMAAGEQLEAFCQQTRPSLFLRSIKSIAISRVDQELTFTLIDNPSDTWPRKRTVSGDLLQPDWMVDCISIRIDQAQRNFIKDLNPTLCPSHLKTAPTINMFFAFPMQHDQLIAGVGMELFNNLPTRVKLSLPFNEEELVKHILNHFEIKGRARTAIKNILKKRTLEECLAKRKLKPSYATCQTLIAAHRLDAYSPTLHLEPKEITTTIASTPTTQITQPVMNRDPLPHPPLTPTKGLPQLFGNLTISDSPPATPPHATIGRYPPQPFNRETSPARWSPVPIEKINLLTTRISPATEIFTTATTTTTKALSEAIPPHTPTVTPTKPGNNHQTKKIENRKVIGRWGEQFLFSELLLHYHRKYHCTEPLPDPSLILSDTL